MTKLLLAVLLLAGCAAQAPPLATPAPTVAATPTATPSPTPTIAAKASLDPGILVHVRLAVETLGAEADDAHAVGAWALAERDWLNANLPPNPPYGLVQYRKRIEHLIDLIAAREDEAAFYAALTIEVAARTELGL